MKIIPTGEALGAKIEGLDLARPLEKRELDGVLAALGKHGVIRFPRETLTGRQLADFNAQLGDLEINIGSKGYQDAGVPEGMILSNIVQKGHPIGLSPPWPGSLPPYPIRQTGA